MSFTLGADGHCHRPRRHTTVRPRGAGRSRRPGRRCPSTSQPGAPPGRRCLSGAGRNCGNRPDQRRRSCGRRRSGCRDPGSTHCRERPSTRHRPLDPGGRRRNDHGPAAGSAADPALGGLARSSGAREPSQHRPPGGGQDGSVGGRHQDHPGGSDGGLEVGALRWAPTRSGGHDLGGGSGGRPIDGPAGMAGAGPPGDRRARPGTAPPRRTGGRGPRAPGGRAGGAAQAGSPTARRPGPGRRRASGGTGFRR